MSSDFARTLRRIRPARHIARLRRRPDEALEFADAILGKPPANLLLDTTVYIDTLQDRLPSSVAVLLKAVPIYHCAVTEAELAAACGHLDPAHPGTTAAIGRIQQSVDRRPDHRQLVPDRGVWREAGVACGTLARVQGLDAAARKRALNDCLIFFTAVKHGCAVLTRNISDFDLIMQLTGRGRAIFYRALS